MIGLVKGFLLQAQRVISSSYFVLLLVIVGIWLAFFLSRALEEQKLYREARVCRISAWVYLTGAVAAFLLEYLVGG